MSERRSFRGCRRRWNWAYREGYVPLIKNKHLDFGIAYHKAMEMFYHPQYWKTWSTEQKLEAALRMFREECEKHRQAYMEAMEIRDLPPDVEEDYEHRFELGEGMLTYHANYVHPKFDNWFRPIATEIAFQVPILNPDPDFNMTTGGLGSYLHCTNSPQCGQNHSNFEYQDSVVVYAGRVDMLVEDTRYGGYYIWDHKTASALANENNDGFLQLDDQIGSYCWALVQELNIDVKGFIYAESRKDWPRPPKFLKRRMGGRSFSTAANQSTTLDIFVPHVKEHDPVAYGEGAYDEYIKYLTSSEATQYHQRFVIVKSDAELRSIGENISLEAADMVDSRLRIYPSVGRYSCSNCAYRQPCLNMMMDEDHLYNLENNYLRTDRRYWMDQEPSSEKSGK